MISNTQELSTSQKVTLIRYKVHTRSNGNLMLLTVFKILFLKSKTAWLYITKYKAIAINTYNSSKIEQIGIFIVQIRHEDNV